MKALGLETNAGASGGCSHSSANSSPSKSLGKICQGPGFGWAGLETVCTRAEPSGWGFGARVSNSQLQDSPRAALQKTSASIAAAKLELVGPLPPARAHHHPDGQAWQARHVRSSTASVLHDAHGHDPDHAHDDVERLFLCLRSPQTSNAVRMQIRMPT